MLLPAGLDPAYVACAAWFLISGAFLTIYHQLAPSEHLKEQVTRRTYARLLPLNEYIDRTVDRQWKKNPPEEIIPDAAELLVLKQRVDRAASIALRFNLRGVFAEFGRFVAIIEIVLPLCVAIAWYLSFQRPLLQQASIDLFGIGVLAMALLLVGIGWVSINISRGADF